MDSFLRGFCTVFRMSGRSALATLIVLSTLVAGCARVAPWPPAIPAHECDRLAAMREDPLAVAPPIEPESFRAGPALAACQSALKEFPGTPRFQIQLARAHQEAGNEAAMVRFERLAAEQGYALAQDHLARSYRHGQGDLTIDYAEAMRWHCKAAAQELPKAYNSIGYMHYHGLGVRKDYYQAAYWIRLAAEEGYVEGANNLGNLYELGYGVPRDFLEAARWYRLAADAGHATAAKSLLRLGIDPSRRPDPSPDGAAFEATTTPEKAGKGVSPLADGAGPC